jgi:hypothetical protein
MKNPTFMESGKKVTPNIQAGKKVHLLEEDFLRVVWF